MDIDILVTVSTNPKDRVRADVLMDKINIKDKSELREYLKKKLGWAGRFYNVSESSKYEVSTISHLKAIDPSLMVNKNYFKTKNKSFPQSLEEFKNTDYKNLNTTKLYSDMPEIIKSRDVNDDEYTYLFYDVEATSDGSFIGIKVKGYKFMTIPIYAFGHYVNKFKKLIPEKALICVAYNDIYDGMMVTLADIHKPETIGDAIGLSMLTIMSTNHSSSAGRDGVKMDKDFISCLLIRDPEVTEIRNPAISYFQVHGFDMYASAYHSGSLKLNSITRGLSWSEDISSNLEVYNKEDIINTYRLFYEFESKFGKPVDILSSLIKLFELSNVNMLKNSYCICSQLAVYLYQKNILSFKFTKDRLKTVKYISGHSTRLKGAIERCKISEDKNENIYKISGKYGTVNVSLAAGEGGAHGLSPAVKYTDGNIFVIDFSSFYPNLFFSKYIEFFTPDALKMMDTILKTRAAFKKSNIKSEITTAMSLKIFINSIYGILDKPERGGYKGFRSMIAMAGHIVIFKLIRYILDEFNCYIIDVNTDGIIVKIHDGIDESKKEILKSDIKRETEFDVSIDRYDYIMFRATGNYLLGNKLGNSIAKGSWLYSNSKPSLIYTDKQGNEHGYLVYNLAQIIESYIKEDEKIIEPKIYVLTKLKGVVGIGEFKHGRVSSLPFGIKNGFTLSGSVLQKDMIDKDKEPNTPEELSLILIKSKMKVFNEDING